MNKKGWITWSFFLWIITEYMFKKLVTTFSLDLGRSKSKMFLVFLIQNLLQTYSTSLKMNSFVLEFLNYKFFKFFKNKEPQNKKRADYWGLSTFKFGFCEHYNKSTHIYLTTTSQIYVFFGFRSIFKKSKIKPLWKYKDV